MSIPLQSVPENEQDEIEGSADTPVDQANLDAAEIIADARRQAESIVAMARTSQAPAVPPALAALGDNAEEIIAQVRKLITKQREMQTERDGLATQVTDLKTERDDLVQRLTDAVGRIEELTNAANEAQPAAATPSSPPSTDSSTDSSTPPSAPTSRYREATSLSARLEKAEREQRLAKAAANGEASDSVQVDTDDGLPEDMVDGEGRSFYSRHSAKLPRLEGDGGRSVLSAVGGMRPEPEVKGRKNRRNRKKQ